MQLMPTTTICLCCRFFFSFIFRFALNDWNQNASCGGGQLGFWNIYYSNLPQALQLYSNCTTGWDLKACKQFKIKREWMLLIFLFALYFFPSHHASKRSNKHQTSISVVIFQNRPLRLRLLRQRHLNSHQERFLLWK